MYSILGRRTSSPRAGPSMYCATPNVSPADNTGHALGRILRTCFLLSRRPMRQLWRWDRRTGYNVRGAVFASSGWVGGGGWQELCRCAAPSPPLPLASITNSQGSSSAPGPWNSGLSIPSSSTQQSSRDAAAGPWLLSPPRPAVLGVSCRGIFHFSISRSRARLDWFMSPVAVAARSYATIFALAPSIHPLPPKADDIERGKKKSSRHVSQPHLEQRAAPTCLMSSVGL